MERDNQEAEPKRVIYLIDPVIPVWVYVLWFVSQLGERATEQQVFVEINQYLAMNKQAVISISSIDYVARMIKSKGLVEIIDQPEDGTLIPAHVHLKITSAGQEELDKIWDIVHNAHTLMGGAEF